MPTCTMHMNFSTSGRGEVSFSLYPSMVVFACCQLYMCSHECVQPQSENMGSPFTNVSLLTALISSRVLLVVEIYISQKSLFVQLWMAIILKIQNMKLKIPGFCCICRFLGKCKSYTFPFLNKEGFTKLPVFTHNYMHGFLP